MAFNISELMKKALIVIVLAIMCQSCATVLGGRKTLKPAPGDPPRKIRWGFVVADVLFFPPGLLIDFAVGTIYRPGHPPGKSPLP